MTNLTHFFMFIYYSYTSLHVSSILVLIIRRTNCINTSSGMITNHTRWCINTIRSPDDEHYDVWNT